MISRAQSTRVLLTSVVVGIASFALAQGGLFVAITAPAPGSTVGGTIAVSADASAAAVAVQFTLDGANLGAEDTTVPYSVPWNTTAAANGAHTLSAVVRDLVGASWMADPITVTVFNDLAPPTVAITAPAPDATVSGAATVRAGASDDTGVAGVQFRLDGAILAAEDPTFPYEVPWDTRAATPGTHTLTAVARDIAGRTTTSAPVAVTVAAEGAAIRLEQTDPAVSFVSDWIHGNTHRPWSGGTASLGWAVGQRATLTFTGTAVSWIGMRGPQIGIGRVWLDGVLVATVDGYSPAEEVEAVMFAASGLASGAHTLAIDPTYTRHPSASDYWVVVDAFDVTPDPPPDPAAPSVTVTSPAAGAAVAGTVAVAASAADNVGVVGVQFFVDGANLGAEDTTAPYGADWNTLTTSHGSYTVTAVARDAAGNSATSAPVTVMVDNAAPAVGIAAPAAGSSLAGTVTLRADASDNAGVAGVQFRLDGAVLGAEDTIAPYTVDWSTADASDGSHTVTAVARDAAGNATTSTAVTVTVDNTAPVVGLTAPAAGSLVSGTMTVSGSASDNTAVAGVQFRLDDADLGAEDLAAPYAMSWDTLGAGDGSHTLTAVARDAAGNRTTSAPITVTVDNAAPTVTVTAPAGGAPLTGVIAVNADASDNGAVAGVQFLLDGAPLGAEDTGAPYSTPWDTTAAANGSHTLTARARDAAGNTATSAAVIVTVANDAGSVIRIEDGNTAISYAGAWNLGNTGRPWSGGTAAVGFAHGQDAFVDFRGRGITWIGFRGPWAGMANVYMDGAFVAAVDLYAPAEAVQASVFTATGLPLGPHTLWIEVTRTKNTSSTDYVVIVDAFDILDSPPDTAAPAVTITSPSGGTTVFGSVPVNASAFDDTGVASVAFFVDGAQIGSTDTISPFGVNWNTATVTDGPHTLTAVARDASSHTQTSSPVTVTVANAVPPALATATRIENTDLGIRYVDGCVSCGQVPTWFHGSRSRGWSDGTASFNRSNGARATYAFTGTAVKWIGFRAMWAGIARVYVDGAFVAEIDLYSATEEVQTPVFQVANLSPGSHTIAVEATGRKHPDAQDYAVVVDAFDVSPALPPPVKGTRHENSSSSAAFTAGWNQADTSQAWSGGTAAVSSGVGERATFDFTGTAVTWIGRRAPDMGFARVYLDGALQAHVDTYYPSSIQGIVYGVTGLAAGAHRLEIEVTGERHANASGHAIAVDAFDVRSRLEETDPAVAFAGTWMFHDTDRNWSDTALMTGAGTAARTAAAGAHAEITFTGTAVTWIGARGPWAGIADVHLDGVLAQRLDLYSAAEEIQVPIFTASGLTPAPHTLRIEVTGLKNPASSLPRVIVDAFDVTIPTPAPPVTRVQEMHASLSYTAGWSASGTAALWSGERARETRTAGSQVTFAFSGTSVRWIGARGFSTGMARVSLDGQFIGLVDTRTPFQEEYQEPVFTRTGLAPGSHTLTIEVVGRNNEAPGSTVERVVIDAFDTW
jgi:hypothetical protein